MQPSQLNNKKIAILATDGFEESELFEPLKALKENGAAVEIISLKYGSIKSWKDGNWGESIAVDKIVQEVLAKDFDGLVLPGGVINSDTLRGDIVAVGFIKDFIENSKPIAAICHAPWSLIETDQARNRKMTSWPSLKTDLINAGVKWVDEEVVSDRGWVTSRRPEDLPAFNKKMIEEFQEGIHF